MRKLILATLVSCAVAAPLLPKKRSASANRGTAHRMNRTHTNRTNQGNARSCQTSETNFATCMQNATNEQMKQMCAQMKQTCRTSNKC